jgi:hypothetical protein
VAHDLQAVPAGADDHVADNGGGHALRRGVTAEADPGSHAAGHRVGPQRGVVAPDREARAVRIAAPAAVVVLDERVTTVLFDVDALGRRVDAIVVYPVAVRPVRLAARVPVQLLRRRTNVDTLAILRPSRGEALATAVPDAVVGDLVAAGPVTDPDALAARSVDRVTDQTPGPSTEEPHRALAAGQVEPDHVEMVVRDLDQIRDVAFDARSGAHETDAGVRPPRPDRTHAALVPARRHQDGVTGLGGVDRRL